MQCGSVLFSAISSSLVWSCVHCNGIQQCCAVVLHNIEVCSTVQCCIVVLHNVEVCRTVIMGQMMAGVIYGGGQNLVGMNSKLDGVGSVPLIRDHPPISFTSLSEKNK